ncbi:MAG: PASTA domain-containing protein [Alicyclobacillaceae bacterium]|nr:PASTA domain-containing protein [Alicyclobacillaceae bacterium]
MRGNAGGGAVRHTRPPRRRGRIVAVQVAVVLALGAVAARVGYVQHAFGPRLLNAASKVEQVQAPLLAPRGSILDSHGRPLAFDLQAYTLDIHLSLFPNPQQLATALAPGLHRTAADVLAFLTSGHYQWIEWPHPVLETDKEAILKAVRQLVPGKDVGNYVTFAPTEARYYPNGVFASNVIGYVNGQGKGQAGLELQYDDLLTGQNGSYEYTREGDGFPVQSSVRVIQKAVPGKDIELTIDQTIQGFVEQEMNQLVAKYHPEHAAIIVMNPKTGAILGMTSRPTFDPNHYGSAPASALSDNWAVNDAFEPGSTFKVPVLAAALATGTVTLDETFESGHKVVAGHTIRDWNGVGWGRITFRQALEESSNVGFATIALKLGWSKLLEYMKKFGYLDKTGVDLPAEANSIVFPPSERGELQLATSGFGQGIAVTPIQQMAAIAAIANGGTLLQPHLLKAVLDPATHRVIRSVGPTVVNPQVVPKSVADAVNQVMIWDVSRGIDTQGYIPGYAVAGKTGTAQVVNPQTGQYYSNRFIVSFIGYAPGWDPQVEVYVTLYWPKTSAGNQWGSTIATPAARDILNACMHYYHVRPRFDPAYALTGSSRAAAGLADMTAQDAAAQGPQAATKYVQTPDLTGEPAATAAQRLRRLGLAPEVLGGSGKVVRQWPQPGVQVPTGSVVYLSVPPAVAQGRVAVPDLRGTGVRQAGNILAALGLKMIVQGAGFAVTQSVPPGRLVDPGTAVTVTFRASAAQPRHP